MSVEESTVIFGPIFQVGWASASSTVTVGQLGAGAAPERAAAGGEQQAGDLAGAAPPRRHWWRAECSLSTGTSSALGVVGQVAAAPPAPPRSATPCWPAPGAGRRRCAASVTPRPAKPTTALTTTSASVAASASASGPTASSVPGGSRGASSAAPASSPTTTTSGRSSSAWAASGVDRAAGAERDDPEAIRLLADHVEGLGADRAGRAAGSATVEVRRDASFAAGGRAAAPGSRRRAARTAARRSGRARRRGRG